MKRYAQGSAWRLALSSASLPIRCAAATPVNLTSSQRYLFTSPTPLSRAPSSSSHYRPFTSADEAQLISVLSTKPRHVARHIRQSMLHSRRRIAQFRNAVTFLMISLQTKLQKKDISGEEATIIMESLMKECVELRQGDMAHLLFRAALRFRKHGVRLRFPAVRALYKSYKQEDAKELMRGMAEELKKDEALSFVAVLAYNFSGDHESAVALQKTIPAVNLNTENYCSLIEGFGMTDHHEDIQQLVDSLLETVSTNGTSSIELGDILSAAIVASPNAGACMNHALTLAKERSIPLSDAAVATVLRSRLRGRRMTSVLDVYQVEADLCAELKRKTLGMDAETAVIGKCSEVMSHSSDTADELMLRKVQHLERVVSEAIAEGNIDDVDPLYFIALIRGYGVMGQFEQMRKCFKEMQSAGAIKDHKLYDEMLKWYAHSYNLKEVIALKEEMTQGNIFHTTQTYNNLFRVLDRYYPRMVEKYLAEMQAKHMQIDSFMYPTLIRVFSALQHMTRVDALYLEAKEKAMKGAVQHFSPALVIQMLRCYSNDKARCDAIINDAEELGLLANEGVQAEVLQHYTRCKEDAAVARFLKRVPQKSSHVFRVLLRDATHKRDKGKFQSILKEMEARHIPTDERLFSVIVTSLSLFHDAAGVQLYVHRALTSDEIRTPLFFADAASAFSRLGDVDAIDRCWDDLLGSKMVITMPVYNRFLAIYMALNNMSKVQQILDTMMKLVPPNPVTATTVVDMLGKMGRLSEMEAILDEMARSTNAAPTLVTYHQAMNAYAKCGDVSKMEQMREKLNQEGFQENAVTYNILFDGYGRAKRFEHLQELMQERKEKGIAMEEFGYVVLLNTFARAKLTTEAEALVNEMVESGTPFNSRLLATVASTFSSVGDEAKMEHYISLLLAHPDCRLRDVESIYMIYARRRDTSKLQQLLEAPKLPTSQFIYNTCVAAFAQAGNHAKVALLLSEMEKHSYALSRNTSVMLSNLLLKAGKLELAQTVLQWKGLSHSTDKGHPATEEDSHHLLDAAGAGEDVDVLEQAANPLLPNQHYGAAQVGDDLDLDPVGEGEQEDGEEVEVQRDRPLNSQKVTHRRSAGSFPPHPRRR